MGRKYGSRKCVNKWPRVLFDLTPDIARKRTGFAGDMLLVPAAGALIPTPLSRERERELLLLFAKVDYD